MDGERIRKRLKDHIKMFNYKISPEQEEEIITLYELNHDEYDENILSLYIEKFLQTVANNPDPIWKEQRRPTVYAKSVSSDSFQLPFFPKTPETTEFLISRLGTDIPFCLLSEEQKYSLINSMHPMEVEADTELIKEGDVGEEMYVVEDGAFEVLVNGKLTNRLYGGAVFGELALLHGIPRTATVRALKKSKVWSAEQTSFSCIRLRNQIYKMNLAREAICENAYLKSILLTKEDIQKVLNTSSSVFVTANSSYDLNDDEVAIVLGNAKIIDESEREVHPKDLITVSFYSDTNLECLVLNIKEFKYR